MIGIAFSKHIKLIVLIQLTSCFSKIHCRRENNPLELSCDIITSYEHVNGTSNHVKKISAVNRCPKFYQNYDIIKKCENLIDMTMSDTDITRFEPVTNRFNNITYWNKHCAICNDETEFVYWPPWSKLKDLVTLCKMYNLKEEMVFFGLPDYNLSKAVQYSIKNSMILISKSNNSTELRCWTKEKWPMNLLQFVAPCLAKQFKNHQKGQLISCQYFRKNGRICWRMRLIIEGIDFLVDENDNIDLSDIFKNDEFTEMAYTVESGIDNVLYLCEKNQMNYDLFNWVHLGVIIISMIFIVFYLFVNFNKKYLKNFPNKIIYSYSISLLVMYLLLAFVHLLFAHSCIGFLFAQFSWFFHFFWIMIISLEFCRLTYCTLRKRKVTVSAQPKRYLVYCVLGYLIPSALPIIYFSILETDVNQCLSIPGHFGIPCFPAIDSIAEHFLVALLYIFETGLSFLIPILFLLQACVLIYVTKCGPTYIRSTANRNHLFVLMKMAYIMGAHWMLYVVWFWYENYTSLVVLSAARVSQLLTGLQGVFVFFVFGFKKKMLDDILSKFKCKERSTQESISAGTGTTVHFQSSSEQINHSTATIE